jgi:hypothetical protein
LYIKPPAFAPVDVGDGTYPDDEDMAKLDYNRRTREGRNPDPTCELQFVVSIYCICTSYGEESKHDNLIILVA